MLFPVGTKVKNRLAYCFPVVTWHGWSHRLHPTNEGTPMQTQATDPAMRQAAQYISELLEGRMRDKGEHPVRHPLRIAIYCNSERTAQAAADALEDIAPPPEFEFELILFRIASTKRTSVSLDTRPFAQVSIQVLPSDTSEEDFRLDFMECGYEASLSRNSDPFVFLDDEYLGR